MSVIIRLQNLPWSASAMDIRRFFFGLQIPDGGVHIVGGDKGDAFIAFSSDEDARRAMLLDGGRILDSIVKLFLSSKTEMQQVIQRARTTSTSEAGPRKQDPPRPLAPPQPHQGSVPPPNINSPHQSLPPRALPGGEWPPLHDNAQRNNPVVDRNMQKWGEDKNLHGSKWPHGEPHLPHRGQHHQDLPYQDHPSARRPHDPQDRGDKNRRQNEHLADNTGSFRSQNQQWGDTYGQPNVRDEVDQRSYDQPDPRSYDQHRGHNQLKSPFPDTRRMPPHHEDHPMRPVFPDGKQNLQRHESPLQKEEKPHTPWSTKEAIPPYQRPSQAENKDNTSFRVERTPRSQERNDKRIPPFQSPESTYLGPQDYAIDQGRHEWQAKSRKPEESPPFGPGKQAPEHVTPGRMTYDQTAAPPVKLPPQNTNRNDNNFPSMPPPDLYNERPPPAGRGQFNRSGDRRGPHERERFPPRHLPPQRDERPQVWNNEEGEKSLYSKAAAEDSDQRGFQHPDKRRLPEIDTSVPPPNRRVGQENENLRKRPYQHDEPPGPPLLPVPGNNRRPPPFHQQKQPVHQNFNKEDKKVVESDKNIVGPSLLGPVPNIDPLRDDYTAAYCSNIGKQAVTEAETPKGTGRELPFKGTPDMVSPHNMNQDRYPRERQGNHDKYERPTEPRRSFDRQQPPPPPPPFRGQGDQRFPPRSEGENHRGRFHDDRAPPMPDPREKTERTSHGLLPTPPKQSLLPSPNQSLAQSKKPEDHFRKDSDTRFPPRREHLRDQGHFEDDHFAHSRASNDRGMRHERHGDDRRSFRGPPLKDEGPPNSLLDAPAKLPRGQDIKPSLLGDFPSQDKPHPGIPEDRDHPPAFRPHHMSHEQHMSRPAFPPERNHDRPPFSRFGDEEHDRHPSGPPFPYNEPPPPPAPHNRPPYPPKLMDGDFRSKDHDIRTPGGPPSFPQEQPPSDFDMPFERPPLNQESDLYRFVSNLPTDVAYRTIRKFFSGCFIPKDGLKLINDDKGQRNGEAYVCFNTERDADEALRRSGQYMGDNAVMVVKTTQEHYDIAIDSFHPENYPDIVQAVYNNTLDTSNLLQNPQAMQLTDMIMGSEAPKNTMDIDENSQSSEGQRKRRSRSPRGIHGSISRLSQSRNSPHRVRSRSPLSSTKDSQADERHVIIGNLPKNCTRQNVRDILHSLVIARKGDAVHLEMNDKGVFTGNALVEMDSDRDFRLAMRKRNQRYRGGVLKVFPASKKEYIDRIEKSRANDKKNRSMKDSSTDKTSKANENKDNGGEKKPNGVTNKGNTQQTAPSSESNKKAGNGDTKTTEYKAEKVGSNKRHSEECKGKTSKSEDSNVQPPDAKKVKHEGNNIAEKEKPESNAKTKGSTTSQQDPKSDKNKNPQLQTSSNEEKNQPVVSSASKPSLLPCPTAKEKTESQSGNEDTKSTERLNWADEVSKEEEASTCVSLYGLPFSCTESNIRFFFKGLQIADNGLHLFKDEQNQTKSEGLVEFVDEQQQQAALNIKGGYIGKRYVKVGPLTKGEMLQRQEDLSKSLLPTPQRKVQTTPRRPVTAPPSIFPPGMAIQASNLPYRTTLRDIGEAFSAFRPNEEEIRIRYGPEGKPTGDALIPFYNNDDACQACFALHNTVVMGRRVFLKVL